MHIKLIQIDSRKRILSPNGLSPDMVYPIERIRGHQDIAREYQRANADKMKMDFWSMSSRLNEFLCNKMGWKYEYVPVDHVCKDRHVMWVKTLESIEQVKKFRQTPEIDVLVIIDTDAWLRDEHGFAAVLKRFVESDKKFLFVKEPPGIIQTEKLHVPQYINGGFMAFKNCPEALELLEGMWTVTATDPKLRPYLQAWPFDQIALNHLYHLDDGKVKNASMVLEMLECNSPAGRLIRHCWPKEHANALLVLDMYAALGRYR